MSKDPFQFWNDNGELIFQRGDVRVYEMEGQEYLFVDQTLYASTGERKWYIHNVLPHAKGKCLEIGLGLGVASKVILFGKKTQSLLTIEKNENVIAAFGRPFPHHLILHADVYEWAKNLPPLEEPFYDLIFVDHFTFESEEKEDLEELGRHLRPLLKPGGRMIFWVDENAPEEDKEAIKKLWV